MAGSVAEFDRAIELDPRQKACTFVLLLIHHCCQSVKETRSLACVSVFRSLAKGTVTVLPRQVHNPMSNQAPDICNCNYPTHRWVSVFFHFRTLAYTGSRTPRSSSGWTLLPTPMTPGSPYGVSCVKLSCMGWRKQGIASWRQFSSLYTVKKKISYAMYI